MSDLSDYKIEFRIIPLSNCWSYTITTPDGEKLCPIFGIFADQNNAESAALRHIENHKARYTLTGDKLREKLGY